MPGWPSRSSGLTSLTTSGIVGSIRHALELSMTVAPRATACGASSREASAPAENRAMSTPSNASPTASADLVRLAVDRDGPAGRPPEASRRSSPTGNSRSLRTWIIVRPTTPVAPTTATVRGGSCHFGHGSAGFRSLAGHGGSIAAALPASGRDDSRVPYRTEHGRSDRHDRRRIAAPSSAPGARAARTRTARRTSVRRGSRGRVAAARAAWMRRDRPHQPRADAPAARGLVDEHVADPAERREVGHDPGEPDLAAVDEARRSRATRGSTPR